MTYTIKTESTAPCHASEADKERGKDAFEAVVRESHAGLLAAADWARGNDCEHLIARSIVDRLEAAERAAEHVLTEGWADQTADSGVTYTIEMDDVPADLAQAMDDDLREELHGTLDVDSPAEWIVRYAAAHAKRFGAEWAPISGGAW